MFPHERKMQQLQQQRQLVEQLRREAAINRITASQVRKTPVSAESSQAALVMSIYIAGLQRSAKILHGSRKRGLPDKRIRKSKTKSV